MLKKCKMIGIVMAFLCFVSTARAQDDAPMKFREGWARYRSGDHKGAVEKLTEAIKRDGKLAEAYYWRGKARAALGQFTEAVIDFDEAIKLSPDFASAYVERGMARLMLKDEKSAQSDWGKAGKVDEFFRKLPPQQRGTELLKPDEIKKEGVNISQAVESIAKSVQSYSQKPLSGDVVDKIQYLAGAFLRFFKSAKAENEVVGAAQKFEEVSRKIEPMKILDKDTLGLIQNSLSRLLEAMQKIDVSEYITRDQLKEYKKRFKAIEVDKNLTTLQRQKQLEELHNTVVGKRLKENVTVQDIAPAGSDGYKVSYAHCPKDNCEICLTGGRGVFITQNKQVEAWQKNKKITAILEVYEGLGPGRWESKAVGTIELGTNGASNFQHGEAEVHADEGKHSKGDEIITVHELEAEYQTLKDEITRIRSDDSLTSNQRLEAEKNASKTFVTKIGSKTLEIVTGILDVSSKTVTVSPVKLSLKVMASEWGSEESHRGELKYLRLKDAYSLYKDAASLGKGDQIKLILQVTDRSNFGIALVIKDVRKK